MLIDFLVYKQLLLLVQFNLQFVVVLRLLECLGLEYLCFHEYLAHILLKMLLLCNIILKQVVGRTRPFDVNTAVKLLVKPPSDYSFPSGHTCAAVTAAAALFFRKSRLWLPVAVAAAVMGFSRLYLYVHYPTDVLGGALLGILCGWIGSILCGQIMKEKSSAGVEQKNRI